jgi:hypothetical protein
MKMLEGLKPHGQYNEHMGCVKRCLEYLGQDTSLPWLFGGTTNAFVLNMNDTVFVDAALAWASETLFELAPNLGFKRDGVVHDPGRGEISSPERFLQAQRAAWDFVRTKIDRGIPCYGWELSYIPRYYVINGYTTDEANGDAGYYYSGKSEDPCPWDKLGTFDVRVVAVHSIELCDAAPDEQVVREALSAVLDRIERPDGWASMPHYTTGLAGYAVWADALESGRAILDGAVYINQVWLEAREMAVAFLQEAQDRLPHRSRAPLREAEARYSVVRDKLRALYEMHPGRPGDQMDWTSTFSSPGGAALVRKAAAAERKGVDSLRNVVETL